MNQGMLILLLSLLAGGQGNTYTKGGGANHPFKAGGGGAVPLTTRHMIRQMHEAIDALQRVEQISRLADFSTIKKKGKEAPHGQERERHDDKNSYIGNIRESFSHISDLLGGGDDDKQKEDGQDFYKQTAHEYEGRGVHESGYADSEGGSGASPDSGMDLGQGTNSGSGANAGSGMNSGSGMNPEALISLVGNLMGSMNGNSGAAGNGTGRSSGNGNNFGNGNGIDIDKLMKMVSLISSLNSGNKR